MVVGLPARRKFQAWLLGGKDLATPSDHTPSLQPLGICTFLLSCVSPGPMGELLGFGGEASTTLVLLTSALSISCPILFAARAQGTGLMFLTRTCPVLLQLASLDGWKVGGLLG